MVKGPAVTTVKFSYDDNGKKITREIKIQSGIKIDLSGSSQVENGKYHIGSDGAIYNEKGDEIDVIKTTKEQVAALEGMSMVAEEEGSNAPKGKFILTDADINAAMSEKGGQKSSLTVNMRQNALGGNKKTHYKDGQWDTKTDMSTGIYSTLLTGEGKPSYVGVSSERTEKAAQQRNEIAWANEHPILNFFKTTFGF